MVAPIGLTFNSMDSNQAPTSGNFGPLSKELYNIGNILKSNTRHNGMVRIGFLE
jgi:hypothetical protein